MEGVTGLSATAFIGGPVALKPVAPRSGRDFTSAGLQDTWDAFRSQGVRCWLGWWWPDRGCLMGLRAHRSGFEAIRLIRLVSLSRMGYVLGSAYRRLERFYRAGWFFVFVFHVEFLGRVLD